jgi:hypothetical protein
VTARLPLPGHIPATGTRRRAQGLLVLRWTVQHIAGAAGLPAATIQAVIDGTAWSVTPETAKAVRRATAKLGTHAGPDRQVQEWAHAQRYVSLWAWDDNIDDPKARASGAARAVRPALALNAAAVTRYERYSVPVLGTPHIRWTGPTDARGAGRLTVSTAGGGHSSVRVHRVAFHRHSGRQPVGDVYPACGNVWCVAGPCMVDEGAGRRQERREARKAAA